MITIILKKVINDNNVNNDKPKKNIQIIVELQREHNKIK